MRHRKAGRRLSRETSHRQAMLRNMVTSLFEHDRIQTTDAKAKELRPLAEKMITLAKRGDLHARRQALEIIRSPKVAQKLFNLAKDQFDVREGGYTRIIKLGPRLGDAAPISIIELLPKAGIKKDSKKSKGKAKKKQKVAETKSAAPTPTQKSVDSVTDSENQTAPSATVETLPSTPSTDTVANASGTEAGVGSDLQGSEVSPEEKTN
ncbi:MAG: 50S ribosomal protein L17 [Deltaproteobacteria bacterium]|nr:50S ribosomal protein L17 [Deltaproteobacteria bacterium]